MITRLSNVIYWLGCIVAAPLVLLGVALASFGKHDMILATGFAGIGIIIYGAVRATRYVLTGR